MELHTRQEQFHNPDNSYRGKPFWAWNGKLEEKELLRQIDIIRQMGFGGYFMHSRTGLETEYLGEEWFSRINQCAEYGSGKQMESWLYDEDRWPSGSAGGMVTKEERYRAMYLEMHLYEPKEWSEYQRDEKTVAIFACRMRNGIFSEKRTILPGELLQDGEMAAAFQIRYSSCNDNYNGYCYLNTMNREAVEKYLEITHEKYKEHCGKRLGREITGIFTDEPHRGGLFTDFAEGERNAAPYTPGLFDEFQRRFGYDLLENLPELFMRKKEGEVSKVTRDYIELCQQLFIECFAEPIFRWCQKNHLIFTGHVLHEDSLSSQTVMQGSLMRFYEYMDDPGMDLLAEKNGCYWVAKQVVSVARQLGKKWVLSELYGCTGWQMNFESYKNVGDWQALFGVNLRCPHLSWYTMKGEAKRDYPASILHQSYWHRDYHYVEDYFSRIHVAMKDGKPACHLLVLNPIESVWARAYSGAFSGLEGIDGEIRRLEEQYREVFRILTEHQIDFDYGEEELIGRHGRVEGGILYVGQAVYERVLVAGMDTMRPKTLELLQKFAGEGGSVIFAGPVPEYVDCQPDEAVQRLADRCVKTAFDEKEISEACRSGQEIILPEKVRPHILVQEYEIKGGRMIALLNADRENGYEHIEVNLGKGGFLERWDPRSGEITKPDYEKKGGEIHITVDWERGGERLYLVTDEERMLPEEKEERTGKEIQLPDTFSYSLTEKNICVLDWVSVTTERGKRIPEREVLKADRALRDILGLSYRGGEMLQPWYQIKYCGGARQKLETVRLEYAFDCAVLPRKVSLAVEDLEHIREVRINDRPVALTEQGRWIDICFHVLNLPDDGFRLGENKIQIAMDYYSTGGIEAVYLLGDFGVHLNGRRARLTGLPEKIFIGDVSSQGLPFYSGGIRYEMEEDINNRGKVAVTIRKFGGALVKVIGEEETLLAFPPYRGTVAGAKAIEVVLTRRNTFGPLHEREKKAWAYGPANFMTEGGAWTDDYMLYEQGLLEKPIIQEYKE